MKQTIPVISIVGSDLSTIEAAASLCRMAEESSASEIIVDFASVHSIDTIFAREYLTRKEICSKMISEVNLSFWARKALEDCKSSQEEPSLIQSMAP